MNTALKDPQGILDFSQDWTNYLASGETVQTSTWTIEGGDASLAIQGSPTLVGNIATAFVKDGTPGQVYSLVNRIVTATRTDERSWTIRVGQR